MGSDRARVSYDEGQQYRSVVMQQGRVTLEADWNEAEDIAAEELRKETLEIVGPSGTPDNGYQIILDPNQTGFDFSIGHGTMYVGGERVYLFDPSPVPPGKELLYSQQNQARQSADPPRPAEWLDAATDPDWLDVPTAAAKPSQHEFIYLQLREQEISAVEDSDLKDVALGGPDTAQRTRLVQHIVRRPGSDCVKNLFDGYWQAEGLIFDPKSMRLLSEGRLQVSFTGQTPPPDPCQPQAQSGYLGAENQLIRVQISPPSEIIIFAGGNNPPPAPPNTILWGFDDASFLYRVDVVNPNSLHLQSAPVDAFHQPRAGQAVEVLLPAVQLSNGEFAAAPTGFVTTVATAYNPDTQTIALAAPLPPAVSATPGPPGVFLRVWEQQLPFTPGVPVPLGSTGVQVTLTLRAGTAPPVFHLGDFWMFAVRPATPQQVYPERFLVAAQPSNGPRLWACPLGVINWNSLVISTTSFEPPTVSDCRSRFSPLTKLVFASANGGATVGPRSTLNFIGSGVTVFDNPAAARIDVTLAGGASGESAPTNLLFPYATNANGLDTEIVISNTTAAPFGSPQPPSGSGKCTIHFFPPLTNLAAPGSFSFTLGPGEQKRFTLSRGDPNPNNPISAASGFVGYIIVACDFAGAYGFADIFGTLPSGGVQRTSMTGYLAVILPKR